MPTQQSISLQAGRSVQRVMHNAPCLTVTDTKYTNQNLSRRAMVNVTLLQNEYAKCLMTRTNFTKSTFALFSFKNCSGESVLFTQASLSDGCLANCEFPLAVWIGSWLQHVCMTDTNLSNNLFSNSNLNFVIFNRACMTRCVFDNAEIRNSKFCACDMTYTNFTNAMLSNCSWNGSNIKKADFSNTRLNHIQTNEKTTFEDCVFIGADLTGNDWTSIAYFGETRFDTATFFQCTFDESVMTNVKFRASSLFEVSLKGTILGEDEDTHSSFSEATLDTIETDEYTVFDFCDFDKAGLANATLDTVSMTHCSLNDATLEHLVCVAVNLSDSTFHHATLTDVTIDADTNLAGVSFIETNMDNVKFEGTTLDNVVVDQSKLFNVNFVGASLIGTSFFGASLSDVDFTDAVLSAYENAGPSEEAFVAAKFAEATITRATFQGPDAYLRFTIFSKSTLSMCTFTGTSPYETLNLSEANFDGATVTDTTFTMCNLANAKFANSTLSRCHFIQCSMEELDTENVQLEYCTVDIKTVLPANWMRDSNGWIVLQDPGELPDEEANHEIQAVGAFGDVFRKIQVFGQMNENGMFIVTWSDGTTTDATRIHHMNTVQPNAYNIGDAVFVCIQYDEAFGDNYYLHGLITTTPVNETYEIEYYKTSAKVQYKSAPTRQNHTNIFPEYFKHRKEGTVAIYEKQYYRSVKQVNYTTVTWYDGEDSQTVDPRQISFKQPTSVNKNDPVFVLIISNVLAEYDNHYLAGIVTTDNGNHTYEIEFVAGGGSTPTIQHIEFLYTRILS